MTTTEEGVFTKYIILSRDKIYKKYTYSRHGFISTLKCSIWIYCMSIYLSVKTLFKKKIIMFIPDVVPALYFH